MNMQSKLISSFLIIFSFSILSFSQNSESSVNSSTEVMAVKIKGMHCAGGCAMAVQKALNNTDGVLAANVDFGSSMAMIEYDSSIKQDEIMSLLENHRGGAYEITLVSGTDKASKSCSKGKQCCKVNGKLNSNCDQKSSGCCSSASKECASNGKNKKKKRNK